MESRYLPKAGRDADEHQTAQIEQYLVQAEKIYEKDDSEEGQMPPHSYLDLVKSGMVVEMNPMNEYLDNIISMINIDAIREPGFKDCILIPCMESA